MFVKKLRRIPTKKAAPKGGLLIASTPPLCGGFLA
jgi:hypothetical protein